MSRHIFKKFYRAKKRWRPCRTCGKYYMSDFRHINNQKYCKECGYIIKRGQKRKASKKYLHTSKGREKKKIQNEGYRKSISWNKYIRDYRVEYNKRVNTNNRRHFNNYYRKHRHKINLCRRKKHRLNRLSKVLYAIAIITGFM